MKAEFDRKLELMHDTKKRWNSLFNMLQYFFMVTYSNRKSFIDVNFKFSFSESNFKFLSDIIQALQPLEIAVQSLCTENTN